MKLFFQFQHKGSQVQQDHLYRISLVYFWSSSQNTEHWFLVILTQIKNQRSHFVTHTHEGTLDHVFGNCKYDSAVYAPSTYSDHFFFFNLLVVFKQVSTYVQTSKLHFSLEYMICFIRNTFISNVRLKLATKIKQMLSNTMRLNLCYLKIIHILPLNSHPTIIVNILKNKQKNKCV